MEPGGCRIPAAVRFVPRADGRELPGRPCPDCASQPGASFLDIEYKPYVRESSGGSLRFFGYGRAGLRARPRPGQGCDHSPGGRPRNFLSGARETAIEATAHRFDWIADLAKGIRVRADGYPAADRQWRGCHVRDYR